MLRTETRTTPRITTRITVESVGPTLNISAGGMCVLMADPMREGTTPNLAFTLPDEGQPITCKGRIMWCRSSKIDPDLFEVGLAFVEIADAERQRIMDFVDAHLTAEV